MLNCFQAQVGLSNGPNFYFKKGATNKKVVAKHVVFADLHDETKNYKPYSLPNASQDLLITDIRGWGRQGIPGQSLTLL